MKKFYNLGACICSSLPSDYIQILSNVPFNKTAPYVRGQCFTMIKLDSYEADIKKR